MISGEHAVLHGRHALVGAVDQRMRVTLRARKDDEIRIVSALGERRTARTAIDASPPFRFVGTVLKNAGNRLPCGMDVSIESDFPPDVGLGSSAAISVATFSALETWLTGALPARDLLLRDTVALVRSVQGLGSGGDVAAAVYGGVVVYTASPPHVQERFTLFPRISLVYAGYKTPTPEVVTFVEQRRRKDVDDFEATFDLMETGTMAAVDGFRVQDWSRLARALETGQSAMVAMGVCDATLAGIVAVMRADAGIQGAKISGSGLGDCVLGIGACGAGDWPYRTIPVALSDRGVRIEEKST